MYRDMPEELPEFMTVCQKRDNQFRQRQAGKAAQNMGGGVHFASPGPSSTPKSSEVPSVGLLDLYRWISAQAR